LAIESDLLLRSGDIAMGVSYLAASVFAGLVATVAGIALAARLPRRGGTR
jgi:fluoride ion exporter CrcB/FEX